MYTQIHYTSNRCGIVATFDFEQETIEILLNIQRPIGYPEMFKLQAWIDLPGGGNGYDGRYGQSCPVGYYVNGVSNWRGGDWSRTGELQIQCCQ